MKIYIASAMFREEEKKRINKIAKLLRAMGYEVYVPHEFQVPNSENMPNIAWARAVFETDLKALNECDAIYYFCEGMEGDIGAAWECGYAYAKGKRIFVDETRECSNNISLMVGQCSTTTIESYQVRGRPPSFSFLPTARARPIRADLSITQHFAQKSAQNFVDYYLLTIPDQYDIISMSRGEHK